MSEPDFDREPRSLVRVKFQDCDAFGMLYNTRYLDYVMDARAEHLIKHYGLDFHRELQRTKETWVVRGHQIAYVEPARVHEEIIVRTRMVDFNGNTCLLEGILLNRDETRLKALQWTRLAYINLARAASQDHPPDVLTFLSRIRAQEDIPQPLDFDARLNQMRARFQTFTKDR